MSGRTATPSRLAMRAVLSLLLVHAGCKHTPSSRPSPPSCTPQAQGDNVVQSASAQAVVGGVQFNAEANIALAAARRGASGVSVGHFVVRRNSEVAVELDTQTTSTGEVQVRVRVGSGFTGPREVLLTSTDRQTLKGTVDGKALAPFSLHAKAEAVKFSDGSAIRRAR